MNLCWQPDLIIMDGRKAFVSGGPDKGQVIEPGLLLASADLVAIGIEAMKHGLGVAEGQYVVLERTCDDGGPATE